MHLVRPPDRVPARFRQRYVARFALLDESGHAANRLLDRNIGIDAGHAEDVQRFDAEASQAFLACPREVLRAATAALARGIGSTWAAGLRMDDDPLASARDGLADQLVVVSAAVAGRGVEEIRAQ